MQSLLNRERRRSKTETTELYDLAEQNDITIFNTPLPETQSVSVLSQSGNCYIGIDPLQMDTSAEERVHLAHELGHCITGAFYNPYAVCDIRQKHEHRADKWAIQHLIPYDDLQVAVSSGRTDVWELADYFDVTEDFICKAVDYYKNAV